MQVYEAYLVVGKFFLLCNINYMLDLKYVFLCVDALHTKTDRHNVCKKTGGLQVLRVQRYFLKGKPEREGFLQT